ncbi:flagellar sheath protein A [Vibrio hyugaensis]|uniref:flagellar sheath protein A n=1 Tax=Vibrio hyugaensis TaxID=1534743 RepID=UPI000CE37C9B|nr:flagellar sheath protein A [Vibrio hyugaensis]
MKQLKVLPLVAIISGLMVGCGGGGGGGGSTPPPKYTWQMVNLYSTERADVGAGCVIYDVQEGQTDRVIAAKVANAGFKVLYHNADGSVISEDTIDVIPSNGKVTIDSGKVPTDGYVSVEELDGTIGGTQDVYMFSVQKSFLRNMVINVRQSQSSSNSCFKGEQNYAEVSEDAAITVAQSSASTSYYQSSFINSAVAGHEVASNIPVRAPLKTNEKVLVTAFDSYSSGQQGNLQYFVFADGASIYDISNPPSSVPTTFMETVKRNDINFQADGISISSDSSIVVGFNSELYQWQPVYDSTSLLSYTDLNANGWTADLIGSAKSGNWNYHSLSPFDGTDMNIYAPTVSGFGSSSIVSGCGGANYCLNATGFAPEDYSIQRTHLRSKTTNSSRNFYQTIFAKPDNNQVLMESSEEALIPNSNEDRLEVTIASLDTQDKNATMYFLENNLDIQSVITTTIPNFNDVNGSVSTAGDIKSRKLKLLSQSVTILENGKN